METLRGKKPSDWAEVMALWSIVPYIHPHPPPSPSAFQSELPLVDFKGKEGTREQGELIVPLFLANMLQRICFLNCAKYVTYSCILYKIQNDDPCRIYANARGHNKTFKSPHEQSTLKTSYKRKKKDTVSSPVNGLIRSGTRCCKLWQTFFSIFNPQPRSLCADWTLWSRSMGGLSQDQDASYSAALCCLSEGRRLRSFPLILCWHIWEGPLLMIMMLRPIAEPGWGSAPLSLPFLYWWYKRAGLWRVEPDRRI